MRSLLPFGVWSLRFAFRIGSFRWTSWWRGWRALGHLHDLCIWVLWETWKMYWRYETIFSCLFWQIIQRWTVKCEIKAIMHTLINKQLYAILRDRITESHIKLQFTYRQWRLEWSSTRSTSVVSMITCSVNCIHFYSTALPNQLGMRNHNRWLCF